MSDSGLELKGTAEAARDAGIDTVEGGLKSCAPTVSPAACALAPTDLASLTMFSSARIRNAAGVITPILVAKEQLIQVTVTYTFAPATGPGVH